MHKRDKTEKIDQKEGFPLKEPIEEIEKKIRYTFKDPSLLRIAFVHRSHFLDKRETRKEDNERLEFLGDSVLNLIVTHFLFRTSPDLPEGDLTQLKEQIVDAPSLKQYTIKLGIEKYCQVGKGEEKQIGEGAILSDLFEALLGAIYLDGGYEVAKEFFFDHFQEMMEEKISSPRRNWKKELQEYVQKEYHSLPIYEIVGEEGPPHKKEFLVSVKVQGKIVGEGKGMSKKEAEMKAAKEAINKKEETDNGDEAKGKLGLY